ncbi:hypothetical protein FHETE_1168 [Fusarium heterosporum]|uniref:Uncharacterized protein n=1 Tax=Fusarium heterosporum TaxID=42747 RepID=A0A8H5X095_FUSHE|nr:hypothetical protein FHETE_1168 [Fusarium heterosporum]
MSESLEKLQKDAITSIASVSTLLRNAIAASLPVAPEQYLTVAIPGTVIDLVDYDKGGSFVYDAGKYALPPTTVRQAEASLVDGMMPIATIMIGNTGKSVARSYSRSLDGLLPAKATITSADGIRSPGNVNYDKAMEYLKQRVPGTTQTVVEVYRDKELMWAKERSAWDKAKIEAAQRAEKLYPPGSSTDFIAKQKQYFNDWNQENYYAFKASVQAAWMDWVVNGSKYDVDFNFGMVDVDSIMSRIEASKESLRNATIPDASGSGEVFGVSLTPSGWATYCRRKAEGWYARNGRYTLAQLESEIARLESLQESYKQAQTLVTPEPGGKPRYPVSGAIQPTKTTKETQDAVAEKLNELYGAQAALAGAKYNYDNGSAADKDKLKEAVEAAQKAVSEAQKGLREAENDDQGVRQAWSEYNRMVLEGNTYTDAINWLESKQKTIGGELIRLKKLRTEKAQSSPLDIPVITGVSAPEGDDKSVPSGTTLATKGSETANPIFQAPAQSGSAEDADPWTTITFSYSASDVQNHSQESAWGMKVGGSVGFGLWSVGGSYSHDEAHKSMQSDMSACDVSISFSALVVNITRPWLYGELFTDVDLEVAEGVKISPGAVLLHDMLQSQSTQAIDEWSQFPAYPTSFIVAADTTIEFTGATKSIEEHFDTHSNSGGASVGYGPWSVSSSFHESATEQSMQVQSTATGCKISFGAPQIIGWVSQIVPPLPRPPNFNPLTQGAGEPVPNGTA